MVEAVSAWTRYWQTGQRHSCINTQTSDGAELAKIWTDLAMTLRNGARVLDLATGNGAVTEQLAKSNQGLHITGVDQAEITPPRSQVSYLGNTNITQLPFVDSSFDVVTSQFGFEYALQPAAALEASRVLADGGQMCLLLHHPQSVIVESNMLKIPEIKALLRPDGLLDKCRDCLHNQLPFADLEAAGQAYLATSTLHSRQITGQVFEAIGILHQLKQKTPASAHEHLETLVGRLSAEGDRLQQMRDAAVSEDQVKTLTLTFAEAGVTLAAPEKFRSGHADQPALIGWLLRGSR